MKKFILLGALSVLLYSATGHAGGGKEAEEGEEGAAAADPEYGPRLSLPQVWAARDAARAVARAAERAAAALTQLQKVDAVEEQAHKEEGQAYP